MERRDFIKQVGAYPLALHGAAAAQRSTSFQKHGLRQMLDLSGSWEFRMDRTNQGVSRKWFAADPPKPEAPVIPMDVPSVWQQYVDADGGIAWYVKTFSLPKDFLGRVLRVKFGAVDYRARVWLNGQELGGHEGAFTPFEFDISQAVRAGTNRLVVRVADAARIFLEDDSGLR